MKTKIASKLSVVVMIGLWSIGAYHHFTKPKTPPPGYCILQDQGGHFFVKWHSPWGEITYNTASLTEKSKQAAVDRAWMLDANHRRSDKTDDVEPIGSVNELCFTNAIEAAK